VGCGKFMSENVVKATGEVSNLRYLEKKRMD
jgi:hypothetical protein